MNNTELYGLFDRVGQIKDQVSMELNKSPFGNVSFYDFQWFQENNANLLFSGIIYNKKELLDYVGKKELADAELLYLLFQKDSYAAWKKINGKYLIILQKEDTTWVSRDRYGQGPLFYYTENFFTNLFWQVKNFKNFDFKPNLEAIGNYLMYSYIPSPLSSVEGLLKLPAGHALIKKGGQFTTENMFTFEEFTSETNIIDEQEALIEYDRLFKQSIKRRTEGYDTVGALLSGGYDSGGNISVVPEVFDGALKSYSIGFKDNPFSELPYAKMMAEKFGAQHNEYLMDGKEINDLPFLVRNMGDPFSESGWMLNNSAMKLVYDKKLPVVLGGDGSDQLFTAALREIAYNYRFKKKGLSGMQKMFGRVAENSFFEKDNIFFKARFHNDKILNILAPDHFGFRKYHAQKLISHKFKLHPTLAAIPRTFDSFDELFNSRNYYVDIQQNSSDIIIHKASRISQMYDVNLAFTYIDEDVIRFVKSLPRQLKAKGTIDDLAHGKGISKYLLKALIKPKLPTEVTSRKKQGGFSPLQIFFSDEAKRKKMYNYVLNSEVTKSLFDKDVLIKFFNAYDDSVKGNYWFWYKQTMANRLINVMVLALWWDIFMNDNYHADLSDYIN